MAPEFKPGDLTELNIATPEFETSTLAEEIVGCFEDTGEQLTAQAESTFQIC